MRFSELKKIMEITASVKEALSYINASGDLLLLNDCTYAISEISTCLNNNKESLKTEKILHDAEALLQQLEAAKTGEFCYEELSAQLGAFSEQCKQNIKPKYKLLFVADIRGKWDSLASVYKAVKEREDCDVDVVIQPVFRVVQLPEGKTRQEVLYEDYLTERGIFHKMYKDYDMEKERPDITFISQPYESCTIPMFWPENIAKYSKLVYCPYFAATTLGNGLNALKMDVEKYAWKIACQSEKMAHYYKSIGSQRGRNVVVSGLPKWDEVVKPDEKLSQCPKEWKKKLEGKKVLLWNTHYIVGESNSGILEKGTMFLNMIKDMNGVALVWRPHPLTEMVIKAYVPERYNDYLELLKMVNDSDNLVLDTNSSYMPAFCASDALITDPSSMITQYLFMDKPIFLLQRDNVEIQRRKLFTKDGLMDFMQLPMGITFEDQVDFIRAIVGGEDVGKEGRKYLLESYYPLADGNCGERFVTRVLEEYITEIVAPEEKVYQGNGKLLIVGPLKDSEPCIEQLKRNRDSFCLCKEFLEKGENGGYEVVSLQEVEESAFDLVVVTARTGAEQTRDFLVNHKNVCKEKTLLFWRLYNSGVPLMVCDRVMQNPKNKQLDGIIIGLSHSEVGIIPDRLPGNWCNLSVSSQDLYYQCKTLEYCVENYYDKIRNLKYAVIDLYDYYYFNYDTSLGSSAVKYLTYGGYNKEAHNFSRNKLTDIPYEKIVEKLYKDQVKGITEKEFFIWRQVFPDVYECANYEGFAPNYVIEKRIKTVTEEDIKNFAYKRGPVVTMHKETIAENANVFQRMMQILKLINPNIKIYTVVIPKYIEVEIQDALGLSAHEEYFNSMVNELQEKFEFKHLDFKKLSDISSYKALYYDAAHLNYLGALRFSDELKKKMVE